ncbi:nischarin [Discoglossus pictus]
MEGATGYMEDAEDRRGVRIVGSELVENYTVYIIEVFVGIYHWKVKHRYSDFHDLHEKLTVENKIDKNLLPPKKIIGKNSKSLVEKRQKDLEVYLQTLLTKFPSAVPRALSHFLDYHLYEIHGIAAVLAEDLFHKGEQLLLAGEVFNIKPLQLYAITQLLRLGKPTCANGDAKTDLGHILDFACRLKYLKISGTRGPVGTSNIHEHLLPYDLSVFKSLCQIEISHCDSKLITGLTSCKKTLATMSIQFSTSSMKDILVPEAFEFDQWEPEGASSECPITAVVPKWKNLTTLDMSHNHISFIDDSVKLIPQIEFLDVSHNSISSIENLQHLYNLIHLDLSYNNISMMDGIHAKVGNIKTLNIAGNLLESLSGLKKLYSLVNLDLSNNKIAQLEEIKNIGKLPCLEKVTLHDNPITIIPDYRTKVLAQFGDRASEVCLDNTNTTEKELDTVEVLKAIQKAKEAKTRLNNSDKKISEDSRLTAASSKTKCSSFPANASPPSLSRPVSSSKDVVSVNPTLGIIVASSSSLAPHDNSISQKSCEDQHCDQEVKPLHIAEINHPDGILQNDNSSFQPDSENNFSEESVPSPDLHSNVFPLPCVSVSNIDEDFLPCLSALIAHAYKQPPHLTVQSTEKLSRDTPSAEPEDGYFVMGLHEGDQTSPCNPSDIPQPNSEESKFNIIKVLWSFSVQLQKAVFLKQFASCLILTDSSIALFEIPEEATKTRHIPHASTLKLVLHFFSEDLSEFGFLIPEMCLTLNVRNGEDFIFVLSDSQSLKEFYDCLHHMLSQSCKSQQCSSWLHYDQNTLQDFFNCLLSEHLMSLEDHEVKGCFPVCLAYFEEHNGNKCTLKNEETKFTKKSSRTVVQSDKKLLPSWLCLTEHHVVLIKVDFCVKAKKNNVREHIRNSFTLSKIPLATVLLYPGFTEMKEKDSLLDRHILQLIMDYRLVKVFFVLPQDKIHFVTKYNQIRTSLHGLKTIVLLKPSKSLDNAQHRVVENTKRQLQDISNPLVKTTLYPSESLLQKLSDENQIPFYLPALSSLHFISELKGNDIVGFFHNSIAEVENEEIKHLAWSSVLFYTAPDLEMTSCILLSTKAIYLLLDDSAEQLDQKHLDVWTKNKAFSASSSFHLFYCFTIKFSDLQSVNIGLFDQYFRITGPSADHVVTCLTRDSYSTHAFIQHLMSVLSLLARTPSPEPKERDFYSEFGTKNTGKMENYELIHSSKVKFIYPNEEEIGDLTFIVTEKMDPAAKSQSLNILLYVLAFQVSSAEGTAQGALLQPKTLILTSSDLFLFNEDYISYPVPDFAKEPPKKDKYQLIDGRRIRDLDRVLMGYQTYPQTLTFVFDDVNNQDLMHTLSMDHFGESSCQNTLKPSGSVREIQWYIFIPSADCREKLISLLARQWEILCGRELPLEMTG